jgi:integrase
VNDKTNVRFWDVRRNKSGRSTSYEVRWVVGGRQFSGTRATKALAESFLSELRQAAKRGEAFDISEGLPASMRRAKHVRSWFAFALAYVDMKWPRAAATTRNSMTDALATVTAALVDERPGQPEVALVRRALRQYALVPSSRTLPRPAEVAAALGWLERASLPLSELEKPRNVRLALDALAVRLDGTAAAATTIRRKRSVFYNVLGYAAELEELSANSLDRVKWKPPQVAEVVDRRVVVNPRQARELLTAVTYVGRSWRGRHLRAFFACMYFAGLRPGEAKAPRKNSCFLPASGWAGLPCPDRGHSPTGAGLTAGKRSMTEG